MPEREPCVPVSKELNIFTLPSVYVYCSLVSVKKILGSLKFS